MKVVLAIDPANESGIATNTGYVDSWIIKRPWKKDNHPGQRYVRFEKMVTSLIDNMGVDVVGVERISGRSTNAVANHAKLLGIVEKVTCERNIPIHHFSATQIKKFATGKGNADKSEMIEMAKIKYGYTGDNDNEADALHLLHLMLETYEINTM